MKSSHAETVFWFSFYTLLGVKTDFTVTLLQETCQRSNTKIIGLKPYLSGENQFQDCRKFWHCRVTSELSNQEVINETTVFNLRIKATPYSCADADPTKPFYDAKACECVSTAHHCKLDRNLDNQFTCTRPYFNNLNIGEKVEACRSFGKETKYFLGDFVHYNDPSKFWRCGIQPVVNVNSSSNSESKLRVQTSVMKCSPGLIWDSSKCGCKFRKNMDEAYRIGEVNKHPMNRYKCATLIDDPILKPVTCKDDFGSYHVGDIPNFADCSTYYSCVNNDDVNGVVQAIPVLRPCPHIQQFNVHTCSCEDPGSFQCQNNLDFKHTFRCANQTVF